jgi:penicillin amidase
VPAAVFHVWQRHLRQKLFLDPLAATRNASTADPAGLDALTGLVDDLPLERLGDALSDGRHAWCDAAGERACTTLALDALDGALDELAKLRGHDMDDWAWGRIHHASYEHMPLSRVKVLEPIFGRRLETGGSPDTIAVANAVPEPSEGYRQTFGAGFRQVFAMARDPQATVHLYMNSTGESGNVFSAHYADMVAPFAQGRLASLDWRAPAPGRGSFVLAPAAPSTPNPGTSP